MPGTKGEATKEAIRRRATTDFRVHGYEATGLAEIAHHLGISRAAVLHHFGSKLDLLHAVVDPYLDAVTELLVKYEDTGVLTLDDRRKLIAEFVDVCLIHPGAAGILSWDITSRAEPTVAEHVLDNSDRLQALVTGPQPTLANRVVAVALFATVIRPLTDSAIDPEDPEIRPVILGLTDALIGQLVLPSEVVEGPHHNHVGGDRGVSGGRPSARGCR